VSEVFDKAVAYVLEQEGGYVSDPIDPGGETNHGISFPVLKRAIFLGLVPTDATARTLTRDQAIGIYRDLYWSPIAGDELPAHIAFELFDSAVNQGPDAATRLLQKALGVKEDGIVGPKTIAAAKANHDSPRLLDEFTSHRLLRYARTANADRFLYGWLRRAVGTHRRGLALLWSVA